MSVNEILFFALIIAGLMDCVVIPRLLVYLWRKQGIDVDTPRRRILPVLRISGALLIIAGFLLRLGIWSI